MNPWLGLALWLAFFAAIAVWSRIRRRAVPRYVLVSAAAPRWWSTRPVFVERPEQLARLKEIGVEIDRIGLHGKSLLFRGRPTMDVIVEADDPKAAARELAPRLAGFSATVAPVGRPHDLRWVMRLWRYL
ncbi:MAG TPA: hypothetical protein VG323_21035 [Thermoanaerobaculia bacterium]|nr:hypothetical protein [Thermoanaerobaculia bacterium]